MPALLYRERGSKKRPCDTCDHVFRSRLRDICPCLNKGEIMKKASKLKNVRLLLSLMTALGFAVVLPVHAQEIETGPSGYCHTTDGVFTDCDGDATNGNEEWSDIAPASFSETGGVVWVDQADLIANISITPENEQNGTFDFTPRYVSITMRHFVCEFSVEGQALRPDLVSG